MPREKVIRAAFYGRVSDPKQEKMYSPLFQKRQVLEYILQHGYAHRTEHEYFDTYTGKDWRHRKELQKLLEAAKRHEIDIVVMYRLDRFARDLTGMIVVRDQLKYYGVTVITLDPDEHAGDDTAMGTIIQAVYGFQAETTRKKIVEITQDGLRERVNAGRILVGRKALYGYDWQDITVIGADGLEKVIPKAVYVINEKETAVVRLIFHKCLEGWGLRRISIYLTENCYPTPNGKTPWRATSVRNILQNRFYIGDARMYQRQYEFIPGEGVRKTMRPESETIKMPEGTVPPIIDEETWNAVQKQLQYNKEHSTRNNKTPEDSLCRTGIAKCGYCGANLSVNRQLQRGWITYVCYRAKNGYKECPGPVVRNYILDGAVWEKAVSVILDPKQVEEAVNKKRKEDPHKDTIRSMTATLHDTISRLTNLMDALETTTDKDARASITLRIGSLTKLKAEIEEQLDKIKREQIDWHEAQKAIDRFIAWCDEKRPLLASDAYEPSYKEKREAIEHIGIHAFVFRDEHKPRFDIGFMPPEIKAAVGDIGFTSV